MSTLDDARAAAREYLWLINNHDRPMWRQCATEADDQHTDAIAPVCLDDSHDPMDATASACCPDPVIEVDSPAFGAYLVELLNADAEEKDAPAGGESTPAGPRPLVVYRATYGEIRLGTYTTAAAARAHCEDAARTAHSEGDELLLDWLGDESEPLDPWELVTEVPGSGVETVTAYTVTPVDVADEYDPEAEG